METNVNESNTNLMNNVQKQRNSRRSHKEVVYDKINSHVRIIEKHKKSVKKWTKELSKTNGTIVRTLDKCAKCKPEETERFSRQLVKQQATLEKKMYKLERAKDRLAKKQESVKELYSKLTNKDKVIYEELKIEHDEDVTNFESVAEGGKGLDVEEIVECTETVVDACLNITTAPDNNVTEDMLNTLDEEIKKTINLFEVDETQTSNNELIATDDYTEEEKNEFIVF